MNIRRDLRKAFGPPRDDAAGTIDSLRSAISEASYLGYANVYRLVVFLNARSREAWSETRKLDLPHRCCVCNREADTYVDCKQQGILRRLLDRRPLLADVPYCREHGIRSKSALVVYAFDPDKPYVSLVLFGRNFEFLRAVDELMTQSGEYPPPWVTFPKSLPHSPWNQGTNEQWLRLAWAPFWNSLSKEDREKYLARWGVTKDWEEWLLRLLG